MVSVPVLLGIITIISLFLATFLGIAMYRFKKKVFRYHRIFAYIAIIASILHFVFLEFL